MTYSATSNPLPCISLLWKKKKGRQKERMINKGEKVQERRQAEFQSNFSSFCSESIFLFIFILQRKRYDNVWLRDENNQPSAFRIKLMRFLSSRFCFAISISLRFISFCCVGFFSARQYLLLIIIPDCLCVCLHFPIHFYISCLFLDEI